MSSHALTVYGPEVAKSGLTHRLDTFIKQQSHLEVHDRFIALHSRDSIRRFYALTGSTGGLHWPLVEDLFDMRPACVTLWTGHDALAVLQRLKGNTQPARAVKGTIRRGFCCDNPVTNLVHVSDDHDIMDAELQILSPRRSGSAADGWDALASGEVAHSSFTVLLKVLRRILNLPHDTQTPDGDAHRHAARSVEAVLALPMDPELRGHVSRYLFGDAEGLSPLFDAIGPLSAWDRLILQAGLFAMPHWQSLLEPTSPAVLETVS